MTLDELRQEQRLKRALCQSFLVKGFTIKEAAEMAGVSWSVSYSECKTRWPDGRAYAKRLGKVKQAKVIEWWNDGDMSLYDIAEELELPLAKIEMWIAKQPGFPGIIRGKVKSVKGELYAQPHP